MPCQISFFLLPCTLIIQTSLLLIICLVLFVIVIKYLFERRVEWVSSLKVFENAKCAAAMRFIMDVEMSNKCLHVGVWVSREFMRLIHAHKVLGTRYPTDRVNAKFIRKTNDSRKHIKKERCQIFYQFPKSLRYKSFK